jgi:lysozyme
VTTSQNGYDLIKQFEGLRLRAYRDSVGIWTVGWGHTAGVLPGTVITQDIAEHLLEMDVMDAEQDIAHNVTVPLNQNQFDALVCWTFNLGGTKLHTSTLLRVLNQGNYEETARQFLRWNKGMVDGQMVELPGLTKRRAAESALFLTAIEPT